MKTRVLPLYWRRILALVLLGCAAVASAQPAARGPRSFSVFDTDGDGFISREEFDAAHAQRAQERRATQGEQMRGMASVPDFDAFDTDHDGKISPEEFAAGQRAHQAQRGQRCGGPCRGAAGMGRNAPSFKDFDLNGDGVITAEEFEQARTKRITERATAGFQMRGLVGAPSFEDIDTNHDGNMTPAEFEAWQAKRRQQVPRSASPVSTAPPVTVSPQP
jgi:Ca2+-binding EF-hand superfamily protein